MEDNSFTPSDDEITSPSSAKAAKKTSTGSPSKRKERHYKLFAIKSNTADKVRAIFTKGLAKEEGGIFPVGWNLEQFDSLYPEEHFGDDDYYARKSVKSRIQAIADETLDGCAADNDKQIYTEQIEERRRKISGGKKRE